MYVPFPPCLALMFAALARLEGVCLAACEAHRRDALPAVLSTAAAGRRACTAAAAIGDEVGSWALLWHLYLEDESWLARAPVWPGSLGMAAGGGGKGARRLRAGPGGHAHRWLGIADWAS